MSDQPVSKTSAAEYAALGLYHQISHLRSDTWIRLNRFASRLSEMYAVGTDTTAVLAEAKTAMQTLEKMGQAQEVAMWRAMGASEARALALGMGGSGGKQRIKLLVAHRPGFVQPTLMARKIATFDQLTRGRALPARQLEAVMNGVNRAETMSPAARRALLARSWDSGGA